MKKEIRKYEFRWWHLLAGAILAFLIWASTYKEEPHEPKPRRGNFYEDFKGYDPERGLVGISTVDMKNRTITYCDDGEKTVPNSRSETQKIKPSSSGTTVYDNNGNAIQIDADPEDFLEQLRGDIDFDDLADEYDYDGEW